MKAKGEYILPSLFTYFKEIRKGDCYEKPNFDYSTFGGRRHAGQ